METTASISPDVDAFLTRLHTTVDETFDAGNEEVSEPMSVIARWLQTEHDYAVCGPSDLRYLMDRLDEAVAAVRTLMDEHLPVSEEG